MTPGELVRSIDPQQLRELDAERMGGAALSEDPYAATLAIVADLLDRLTGQDDDQ